MQPLYVLRAAHQTWLLPCVHRLLSVAAPPAVVIGSNSSLGSSTPRCSPGQHPSAQQQLLRASYSTSTYRQHHCGCPGRSWPPTQGCCSSAVTSTTTTNTSSSSSSTSIAARGFISLHSAPFVLKCHTAATAGFHTSACRQASAARASKGKRRSSTAKRPVTRTQPKHPVVTTHIDHLPKSARLLLRVIQQQHTRHDTHHLYSIARQWHRFTFLSYSGFREALSVLKRHKLIQTVDPDRFTRSDPARKVYTVTEAGRQYASRRLPPSDFQLRVAERVQQLLEATQQQAEQQLSKQGAAGVLAVTAGDGQLVEQQQLQQ